MTRITLNQRIAYNALATLDFHPVLGLLNSDGLRNIVHFHPDSLHFTFDMSDSAIVRSLMALRDSLNS